MGDDEPGKGKARLGIGGAKRRQRRDSRGHATGDTPEGEVAVDPHERPAKVEEALVGAAMATCERARVDLVSLDADGARWRVSGVPKHGKGAASLADAVAQAISDQGIGLGRGTRQGTRP